MNEVFYLVSSFWLGALHAATPGHGKTIAAAYIVGARGRPVDALVLGIFVTLSHTSGIVLVAVLATFGSAWFLPQRVEAYVAVMTGLLVIGMGAWLLWSQPMPHHHHDGAGMAQAPLPILRGIIVMPSGDSRAYFEDAQTGHLAGYAVRDLVGESRVEEIRDDRVVLRHGGDIVHVFLGGVSGARDRANPVSASTAPSPLLSDVKAGPVVDNGEAWLEHLGIPSKALSQAIERAPTKGPDNLEDD